MEEESKIGLDRVFFSFLPTYFSATKGCLFSLVVVTSFGNVGLGER